MTKPYLYVIDIDGTVANNKHREHYIKRVKPDWDGFFSDEEVIKDKAIPEARKHFKDGEFIHGEHKWLTARVEISRAVTAEWLKKTGFVTEWDGSGQLRVEVARRVEPHDPSIRGCEDESKRV